MLQLSARARALSRLLLTFAIKSRDIMNGKVTGCIYEIARVILHVEIFTRPYHPSRVSSDEMRSAELERARARARYLCDTFTAALTDHAKSNLRESRGRFLASPGDAITAISEPVISLINVSTRTLPRREHADIRSLIARGSLCISCEYSVSPYV